MRIATFNLESLDMPPRSRIDLDDRIRILRPQIERLDADILCFQEVNGQHVASQDERRLVALERLLETTQYEAYQRVSTTKPEGEGVTDVHNLITLSRFNIAGHHEIRHSIVMPPEYCSVMSRPSGQTPQPIQWDRPVLHTEITIGGRQKLHVLNLHLRAPLAVPIAGGKLSPFVWNSVGAWAEGYFLAGMMRSGQALEVRLVVEQILNTDGDALIIVCGDFNAERNETPVKIIAGAEEDTGNGRLGYRSLISLERSIPHDRCYSVLHHGRPLMLDHILVSRPLLSYFRELQIHNETLEDELVGFAKTDRPPDSYHAPLVACFSLGD